MRLKTGENVDISDSQPDSPGTGMGLSNFVTGWAEREKKDHGLLWIVDSPSFILFCYEEGRREC